MDQHSSTLQIRNLLSPDQSITINITTIKSEKSEMLDAAISRLQYNIYFTYSKVDCNYDNYNIQFNHFSVRFFSLIYQQNEISTRQLYDLRKIAAINTCLRAEPSCRINKPSINIENIDTENRPQTDPSRDVKRKFTQSIFINYYCGAVHRNEIISHTIHCSMHAYRQQYTLHVGLYYYLYYLWIITI